MSEQPSVVCVGEALVDFIPNRRARLRDVTRFTKTVGGAPANVAIGLARQGVAVSMISRVGNDEFGHFITDRLAAEKVGTDAIVFDEQRRTGITFLQVDEDGERSFLFFREHAAEKALCPADIPANAFSEAKCVHLCTNPLLSDAGRLFTYQAVRQAQKAGALVSIDANLRTHLWPSNDACVAAARELIGAADIVKVNEPEAELLTGQSDPLAAAHALHRLGPGLCVVTLGAAGCVFSGSPGEGECAAPLVDVVDTTGAGDAFCAGMLACLVQARGLPVAAWPLSMVDEAMRNACKAGAAAVGIWGATGSKSPGDAA